MTPWLGRAPGTLSAEDFAIDLGPPLSGDRAVRPTSASLAGRAIALGVCGGIAAYRAPDLVRALRRAGADVTVFATPAALTFVTPTALEWAAARPPVVDLDGRAAHVEQGPFDLWLLAPATYDAIGKIAHGIADGALTTAWAVALGALEQRRTRVAIAPTMHGSMWNALLRDHLARLANLGVAVVPPRVADGKALLPEAVDLVAAAEQLIGHGLASGS